MIDLGVTNRTGILRRLPPNASLEQQVAVINDIILRLNGMLQTQVLSDGTTKRMLFGYQKDGWGPGKDFGMKVSIEGVDVTTAQDGELLFTMNMDTWSFFTTDGQINHTQIGVLPDGSAGFITMQPGYDVSEGFD